MLTATSPTTTLLTLPTAAASLAKTAASTTALAVVTPTSLPSETPFPSSSTANPSLKAVHLPPPLLWQPSSTVSLTSVSQLENLVRWDFWIRCSTRIPTHSTISLAVRTRDARLLGSRQFLDGILPRALERRTILSWGMFCWLCRSPNTIHRLSYLGSVFWLPQFLAMFVRQDRFMSNPPSNVSSLDETKIIEHIKSSE